MRLPHFFTGPLLLFMLSAAPLYALATVSSGADIVPFGDSITQGDYDGNLNHPCTDLGTAGYPNRLAQQLPGYGWSQTVLDADIGGVGGERTTQALSRIDTTLSDNGDGQLFLLMEGTNDVSHVSQETTLFDLEQLGRRAEAHGYAVLLASIIPRSPYTKKDTYDSATSSLSSAILTLAQSDGWPVVDPYGYFRYTLAAGHDNYKCSFYYSNHKSYQCYLYETYYFNNSTSCGDTFLTGDPGHPRGVGYDQLVEPFRDAVIAQLGAGAAIAPLAVNGGSGYDYPAAGSTITFRAQLFRSDIVKLDWRFGDGGHSVVDFSAGTTTSDVDYMFMSAGTYTVTLTWHTSGGASGAITRTIKIPNPPSPLTWLHPHTSVVPLAFRGTAAAPDDLRFDLQLDDGASEPVIAQLTYLPQPDPVDQPLPLTDLTQVPPDLGLDIPSTIVDLREDVPHSPIASELHFVHAGENLDLTDLLLSEFGTSDLRGSLLVTFYYLDAGSAASLAAGGSLYQDGNLALGASVTESADSSWSSSAVDLSGLSPSNHVSVRLALTDLSQQDTWTTLHLFDSSDTEVATAEVGLLRQSVTRATLDELFPDLSSYSTPLRLHVDAPSVAGVLFDAQAIEVDSSSGAVTRVASTPAP